MKKVLIITYYWPPSGGAGVMRWLKMSKYLPEFGWQPVIFTPLNPDSGIIDFSLLNDVNKDIKVIKTPIWEPYSIYKWLTGKSKDTKFGAGYIIDMTHSSIFSRISVFLRGNFMIPDPRLFWIRPSVKYLKKYLIENKIDLIVTTGPPHSMHLIGLKLRKIFNIKWLADFRDPWTQIAFYHKLKLTKWADKKHHKLEKKVLEYADILTTVSPGCAKDIESLCSGKKVHVIYNGFDPEDFSFQNIPLDKEFTITHLGSLTSDRNPIAFWKALGELKNGNHEFAKNLKIQTIGYIDNLVIKAINDNGLSENHYHIPSVEHNKGILMLKKSQLLLLPINVSPFSKGILPGKMYEYLAVRRPIIAIGPKDGDFVKIIEETKVGITFDSFEIDKVKIAIQSHFNLFKKDELKINSTGIDQFSRKQLVKKLVCIVESTI